MKVPTVDVSHHQSEFRITLFNTKKSAVLGLIFLILPLLFLSGVVLKHYLQIDFGIFTSVYEWIGNMDQEYGDGSLLNWVIRFLLLFGPLLAIGINLISIVYIRHEPISKEILISIKLKWVNLVIIFSCFFIFFIFFSYLILENIN